MENKEISNKKYVGLAAVIFILVLVTSNFGAAFSQNSTDELLNLNLTGGDILSSSNPTDTNDSSNEADSDSAYTISR